MTGIAPLRAAAAMERCIAAHRDVPPRPLIARVFGVSPLTGATRRLYRTAHAVAQVRESLARLGHGWRVFDGVVLDDGAVLDAVAVGPGGVFLVPAVDLAGRELWVGGNAFVVGEEPSAFLRQVEADASALARMLNAEARMDRPVSVQACVVPIGSREIVVSRPPNGILVLQVESLLGHLRRSPAILSSDSVEAVSAILAAHEEPIDEELLAGFEGLSDLVDEARRIRLAWTAALLLGPWTAFMLTAAGSALGAGG